MRIVVTAKTASELPRVFEELRACTACLDDATLVDREMRLPFEFIDSDNIRFGRSLTNLGRPTAMVPVMQAYLVVRNVASCATEYTAGSAAGTLTVDYDETAMLWTLRVAPQAALRVSVEGLDACVLVSDEQIGEIPLTMCT